MQAYQSQYPEKNMFIEASAGTGKTFTITSLVKQLIDKHVPLEKILIVTYTEKAAGELKDRIRSALKLDSIDSAPIFTIHSFCQQTIQEFAFNARSAYELEMIDESEIENFINRLIRDELKDEEAFCFLYENNASLSTLQKELMTGVQLYYQNRQGKSVSDIVTLDSSEEDWEELKTAFAAATKSKKGDVIKQMLQVYAAEKLPLIYRRWQEEKQAAKVQTFDDMLRTVREAVKNPATGLCRELKAKYSYAIIDEFQDTNQKQWDIFTSIFTDADHRLIVVGDPKQSIYSFQGANVQVYRNATHSIESSGGAAYSLSNNWRSSEKLIAAFNALFSSGFFSPKNCSYTDSLPPPDEKRRIPPPLLYDDSKKSWEDMAPLWISSRSDSKTFAKACVQKIVHFASKVPGSGGKSRLQIGAKKEGGYQRRSVSFKDFAVLARTRVEMEDIERELKISGIPFRRYKDDKLFATRECQNWISLFRAIDSPDFSGSNRSILRECLFTDFFRTDRSSRQVAASLSALEDSRYDSPDCEERRLLAKWKHLADKESWSELLETIYEDTGIEKRFSALDELDSLARYRQLGDYAIEYLYSHNCSLGDAISHLQRLLQKSESAENDNNLLAKNTDFDAVQVMTIHASKGLEFPVVIAVAGSKKAKSLSHIQLPVLYNAAGKSRLSFASQAKAAKALEEQDEWQRLFYVAYTRPTQLLLLPQYEEWIDEKSGKSLDCFVFLNDSFERLLKNHPELCQSFSWQGERLQSIKEKVLEILSTDETTGETTDEEAGAAGDYADSAAVSDETKARLRQAKGAVIQSLVRQHSYTTLSGRKENPETDDGRLDTADEAEAALPGGFDRQGLAFPAACRPGAPALADYSYPSGKNIGIALHAVFEKLDFIAAGKLSPAEIAAHGSISRLISQCLQQEGFSGDSLITATAQAIYHTLHAKLPRIQGDASPSSFSLAELSFQNRKAEIEFELNPYPGIADRNFCKGFIDLLFLRQDSDGQRYCILDWKSDALPKEAYSDCAALKAKVDKDYAIQRVLYSYSLIIWLKQFYPQEDEETILKEHFGGIYYVFVRGCSAKTGNGIYAQSWKSFSDLKAAFDHIISDRIGLAKKESY